MLQQARQRADVYVVDECRSTKKVGTVTPRVSTNTNTPIAAKTTLPVPMDVSQISSNVSKHETEEQEGVSYQYEQDQECGGDEVYVVKERVKVVSKEFVSNVEREDTKADRCWQRVKGKGSKVDWEKGKGGSRGKGVPKSHVGQFLIQFTLVRENVGS